MNNEFYCTDEALALTQFVNITSKIIKLHGCYAV